MPRPHRFWVPGGIYHITARGNNRQPIFLDGSDYQQYLLELRRCRDELSYRLLAFALMPNHVHLVMAAFPETSLSEVMHRVATSYTRYFNGRYGRVGHLYQGRFYSSFVNRDAYLLEVTRYVHLNPVRARFSQQPGDYPWSSYRTYVGLQQDPLGLVERRQVLGMFGGTLSEQLRAYRDFVEGVAETPTEEWLRGLHRKKLIPPPHWLKKVPGTFFAL
jgi:REP element-mobilizing transposase RayT